MNALKVIYAANILVAGWISLLSVFSPKQAAIYVFSDAYESTPVMRLTGALWFAIALLSLAGLWRPITYSPVLLLQLIYKSMWLLVVALPALRQQQPFPVAMAWFFLVWVMVLPWAMPWKHLLHST